MSIVVILLLVLYVGSAVSVRSTFAGTIVNQVFIFAVPVLVTWYMKSNQKELFCFKKPKKGTIPGSIFLYLGTYCLEMAIAGILIKAFPASAENVSMSFEQLAKQPVILMLIVMALMPAIGEEICFRGFLYGGLKNKYGVKWAVVLSAIVFSAFHMSLVKLLPTAMLGACLAYIVSVSGSIYIGMVLHFVNNAFSMLQMKYPDVFAKLFPVFAKPELTLGDTLIFMGVGLIMISIGIPLLKKQKNKT